MMIKNNINKYYLDFKVKDYIEDNYSNISKNVIDCSLGVNPFKNPKTKIIKIKLRNKYPDIYYNDLKKIILKNLIKINKSLIQDNISFGQGSMGVIRNLFQFLIEADDIVLGYSPQFPRVISEIELQRGKYDYYQLEKSNNYKFLVNDFIKKITCTTKIIYIDNPNNPTGQIIHINDIEQIVIAAKKTGTFVIIDEAYGDYMDDYNSGITLINKYDNIIVVKSASKFLGIPEYRIGYIFASEEFIKIYNKISLPFQIINFLNNFVKNEYNNNFKKAYYKRKTAYIKRKLIENINKENYICTNNETPILTITSNKYDNLYVELLKNGILSENCSQYINLNEKYARIRINKKYKKVIKILKKVL